MLALTYVLAIALVALGVPLLIVQHGRVADAPKAEVRGQAVVLAGLAAAALEPDPYAGLGETASDVQRLAEETHAALMHAAPDPLAPSSSSTGVAGCSRTAISLRHQRPAGVQREEISAALAGELAQEQRDSEVLNGRRITITAAPITVGGRVAGAVRITREGSLQAAVPQSWWFVWPTILAGAVVLLGLAATPFLASALVRPVQALEAAVQRVIAGDLSARAPVIGSAEQRLVARAFNDMTDRLRRMFDGQQAFLADASHQMRTPLTAMRLNLDLIRRRVDADPGLAGPLAATGRSLEGLEATVNDLLSQIRHGGTPLDGTTIELAR